MSNNLDPDQVRHFVEYFVSSQLVLIKLFSCDDSLIGKTMTTRGSRLPNDQIINRRFIEALDR